jgi:hypothetical protein
VLYQLLDVLGARLAREVGQVHGPALCVDMPVGRVDGEPIRVGDVAPRRPGRDNAGGRGDGLAGLQGIGWCVALRRSIGVRVALQCGRVRRLLVDGQRRDGVPGLRGVCVLLLAEYEGSRVFDA